MDWVYDGLLVVDFFGVLGFLVSVVVLCKFDF